MYYSPQEFVKDVEFLVTKIKLSGNKYNQIYGIPRGGIPLAVALSYKLKILLTNNPLMGKRILIVDDIVDSGKTRFTYLKFDFVSIHIRSTTPGLFLPTFHAKEEEDYVNYFWETD